MEQKRRQKEIIQKEQSVEKFLMVRKK